ncbi:hypothetical protein EG327_002420 [Venturia inaequalis]|uniref:Carboxylesterase type B domain-containing protein n=1 Tax=Venturia inaequalis TaxID=5025 RepID=A0A8H3VGF3_VENIN|nr:hypothetical protein EG327_002420 [Venturia inaequalis]
MAAFNSAKVFALALLAIFPVLAAPATLSPAVTSPPGPTVTIASGVVVGKTTTISNQPSVTAQAKAYLGVPFAQSPPLRFSPPVAAAAWSSPIQAQALKPSCIGQLQDTNDTSALTNPIDGPIIPESEDCLYLNVYTPANATAGSNKPVMFWLFGGNLQYGSGSLQVYDGTSLAVTQDVVVVTINYRTNIFGFSSSPEVPFGSQNSGFLDQRFALQWVQKNIAQFGGDPAKVMIFGESAGGESVKQLLASPPSPLPFHSAIMESQQTFLIGDGKANYLNVLAHFGCTTIQCLRQVSAADIKNYTLTAGLMFPPAAGDGTYVKDIRSSISSGKFAKVPIMMGTNLNEARLFLGAVGLTNDGSTIVNSVLSLFGLNSTAAQQNILSKYAADVINNDIVLADRIITDATYTCTTSSIATFLNSFGYTVWRYRYNPSFPSTNVFPNSGAYHTSEIPEVFGTYPLSDRYGNVTQQQIQLSAFMQGAWAKMARNPSQGPGWPKIGSNFGFELGDLGLGSSSGVTVVATFNADYACAATVHSIIRSSSQSASLQSLGAHPIVQSIEDSSVSDLATTIRNVNPSVVIWSAGAGGGDPSRTDTVDRKGAIKSMDATAEAGVSRYIIVSALDVRDRESKPIPEWYNDDDKARSDRVWGVIGAYMKAKLDADTELVRGNEKRKLKYTIVRPGQLTEDDGKGTVIAGKIHLGAPIAREDVARTVVECIKNDGTIGLAFDVVGGDEDVRKAVEGVVSGKQDTFEGYH